GGLLDFDTFDTRIVDALAIAKVSGMDVEFIESDEDTDHPNTARIHMSDDNGSVEVVGISIGGGTIEITEINGFTLKMSGNHPALFVVHEDRFGMIAAVANVLSKYEINICQMEVSRKTKGFQALMAIETDQKLSQQIVGELNQLPHIISVAMLNL
ncbi:MAG: ACT domain-containing protein, partial [Bacilli bacterium]